MKTLVNWIEYLKRFFFLQLFTIYLRYLIGGAFVIAAIGMGKLNNIPLGFSEAGRPIGELMPIQQFFRVMVESGLYWNFIGWSQIIGGFLLITQKFAKLGALIFFGIILNIFVITVAYRFTGTPIVTGLMLLATFYLLVWDLASLQFLVVEPKAIYLPAFLPHQASRHPFWVYLGCLIFVTILLLALMRSTMLYQLFIPFLEGMLALPLYLYLNYRSKKKMK